MLGRGLSDSVEVGGEQKIHWSGLLVPCQSTSTRVWLGFGGRWGVAKQAVWSLTVGVGQWRVGVKRHSGWVPRGVHSQPERHGRVSCSLLIFIVKHLHLFWFCVVNTFFVVFFFSLKTTFFCSIQRRKKSYKNLKAALFYYFS